MLFLWVDPARHRVAEEDEVRDDSSRIHADHLAHSTKGRILQKVSYGIHYIPSSVTDPDPCFLS
jgi:hypothetical protein